MYLDLTVVHDVSASHPQLALDIWRKEDESLIAQVKPTTYEEAAEYLTKQKNTANFMQRSHLKKLHFEPILTSRNKRFRLKNIKIFE